MLAVIIGLIFVTLGLWGVISWWLSFIVVAKGLIPVMFACGGMLAVVAGITSIKDSVGAENNTDEETKE